MKAQVFWRKLHHWSAPLVLLPLGIMIGTGLLLMLKKDIEWIQPPTQRGEQPAMVPSQSLQTLFQRAQQIPELALESWTDLDRVDVKPDKGVIKFIANNHWEAQLDAHSGAVLQVAYRRSDLIESLHDGSFFSGWTKHYLFLPTGIVLLMLWATGIYLFFITQSARARKKQRVSKQTNTPHRQRPSESHG